MSGQVQILNVGEGDLKVSFDPKNPAERIRAARIVTDMLRRGYALLAEVKPGEFQRVERFDPDTCEYIIAEFDPSEPTDDIVIPIKEDVHVEVKQVAETAAPAKKRGRPRKTKETRLDAGKTKAVAVARTAGG